jgi:hypothetical protein
MAKAKSTKRRGIGGRFRRRGTVRAAKPSVAILAGLAVGPAQILAGGPGFPGYAWKTGNVAQTVIDRAGITYLGYQPSNGAHWSWSGGGGGQGTLAIIVGTLAHAGANWSGLNRYLARAKMPFRI